MHISVTPFSNQIQEITLWQDLYSNNAQELFLQTQHKGKTRDIKRKKRTFTKRVKSSIIDIIKY